MKLKTKVFVIASLTVGVLLPLNSFATKSFQDLPIETVMHIYSNLQTQARMAARVDRFTDGVAVGLGKGKIGLKGTKLLERLENIDRLLELDHFIELPKSKWKVWPKEKAYISHIGVTQELWFEVMGNNPSNFKEQKYCPETFKVVDGIPMCPDFPVETVQAENKKNKNSDVEFIARLNKLFKLAKRNQKFRRATLREYTWADTEGGENPKLDTNPELWRCATYVQISELDPTQDPRLQVQLPSHECQTHSVKAKDENKLGFRRSGVWEWMEDVTRESNRVVVGGTWCGNRRDSASGILGKFFSDWKTSGIGASRLVLRSWDR